MSKGLPRALARSKSAVRVKSIPIDTTVTVGAAGAAVGFGTVPLMDLPEGNVYLFTQVAYLTFATSDTDISADFDGDVSLGLAATSDADLDDANEQTLTSSTPLGAATARVSPVVRTVGTSGELIDNTSGDPQQVHLNLLIDAAKIADGGSAVFTVTGTLHMLYAVLGDD